MLMRASAMRSAPHRLLGDRLAEGHALGEAAAHLLQRALGQADEPHAVVDAPGPEAALGDLEAGAPRARSMLLAGTRTSSKLHLRVAVRRVVVAEDAEHALAP